MMAMAAQATAKVAAEATRQKSEEEEEMEAEEAAFAAAEARAHEDSEDEDAEASEFWFYRQSSGKVRGPFAPHEMRHLYEDGTVDERTKVRWLPVAYERPAAADQPRRLRARHARPRANLHL